MATNIKERIRQLCRENGITAKELERLMGYGNGYISKIGAEPSIAKMKRIADYFAVPLDWLLTGNDTAIVKEVYEKKPAPEPEQPSGLVSLLLSEANKADAEDVLVAYNVLKALNDKTAKRLKAYADALIKE